MTAGWKSGKPSCLNQLGELIKPRLLQHCTDDRALLPLLLLLLSHQTPLWVRTCKLLRQKEKLTNTKAHTQKNSILITIIKQHNNKEDKKTAFCVVFLSLQNTRPDQLLSQDDDTSKLTPHRRSLLFSVQFGSVLFFSSLLFSSLLHSEETRKFT
jgi:hypothetical protein